MTFAKRKFEMRSEQARESLLALVRNLPLSGTKPLQVTVEEYRAPRKPSQNALYWAGPLNDIARQAWIGGRQFSAETLHEFFKREFLPEERTGLGGYDPELCLAAYRKWDIDPAGNRVLIGSTTQLTVRGMADFITQVEAFGAELGVTFSTVKEY